MFRRVLFVLSFILMAYYAKAQHRPTDILSKEDRIGVTGMFKYSNNNWNQSQKSKYGNLNFDSFRVWGQTDIENLFFASAQYRFYEGWSTMQHLFIGFHLKNTIIKVGQTWVPFGLDWQPFDDWGNTMYYVGLQDDYDYGATITIPVNNFSFDIGFFKNQQHSSSSTWRYDADLYSGDINGGDDLILVQKENEETNQINLNAMYNLESGDLNGEFGASFMAGQIYNIAEDDFGNRFAYTAYARVNFKFLHANAQFVNYDYKQKLSAGATPDDYNFINMSCFALSYEIPKSANVFAGSLAADILGDKLTYHINYSLLTGGTSEANSHLITTGLRSFLGPLDLNLDFYYGINDPQFSGDASGFGRNQEAEDFRVDLRVFYKLNMLKKKNVKKVKKKSKE